MLTVQVRDGEGIERAIKNLKKKFEKTGLLRELRKRQSHKKPSKIKREILKRARHKQRLLEQED